jgi:hypothetical protein|tara:strand:- start:14242 stop:14658 length:417 start_codon:yes stop_codon:yes gene_type:complete
MSLDYLNFKSPVIKDIPFSSHLVDPKIKNFFNLTLRKCHDFKNKHNTMIFNLIYLFIFLFILGIILLYKYKGKKNSYEKNLKDKKDKEYILAKLIHINKMSNKEKQNSLGLITDLPSINNVVNQNFNYNNFRKQIFNN